MAEPWRQELFRKIPKVDEFLVIPEVSASLDAYPRWVVLDTVREILEERRVAIAGLDSPERDETAGESLLARFMALLPYRGRPHLHPVINATGIIVHTNLGRSLLARSALRAAGRIGGEYSVLEYDLAGGSRGSRQSHTEELLVRLTGAEAALVVNNNAAAVFLSLNTIAAGREVIVSRGQLVEIGGSFRIPDVMSGSGALLREVGTTNKTHLRDYRGALSPETALLLKVHTSNFAVVGFTATVELPELAALGRETGVPVMEDLGSGSLVDLTPFGLTGEPAVPDVVAAGADLVSFSGDKLLGGPQAGLIVGRRDLVDRIRANPLHRALRVDKFTIAALEATLRIYLDGERALREIPTLRMISEPAELVRRRAGRVLRRLPAALRRRLDAKTSPSAAQVGGGALPLQEIPSAAISLGGEAPAHDIEAALRRLPHPVIGRLHEGRLILDMRTVADAEVPALAAALAAATA